MLSLIAIAKNESSGIQEYLNHHRDLFDEMIVVDTGSTDGTADLARNAGAHVIDFAWIDDFAAARNVSLRAATGDWVFWVDIDERIARQDFEKIRALVQGEKCCYMCQQLNYYNKAEHQEWQPVSGRYPLEEKGYSGFFAAEQHRLFPVHPDIHWQGCVHEDLSASINQRGWPVRRIDIPIHHYGYVISEEVNRGRNEFYGRLVRKKVAENPDDWKANLELVYILIQEGRARESMPILEKLNKQAGGGLIISRVRVMLAKLYAEDDRVPEAIEILELNVKECPDWIFGWTSWINLLLAEKQYPAAEEALKSAKSRFPENPQLLRHECQLLVNTRRIVEAIPVGRRVTELIPSMPEYAQLADKCEVLAHRAGLL